MDNELMNGVPEEEEETAVQDTAEEENEKTETDLTEEETAAEDAGEASQTEEEQSAEEAIDDDSLCVICGINEKADDEEYCEDCLNSMYKRRIPLLAWISGTVALCMSFFALAVTFMASAPAISVAKGDLYAAENCWYSAYVEYSNVSGVVDEITQILGEESPFIKVGKAVDGKMMDSYAKCRSPLDAVYLATMMYGEAGIEKIPGAQKYIDIYNDFYQNYSIMGETLDSMMDGAKKEDVFAALESFKGTEGINEVFRNYFLFNAADYYNLSSDEKLKYVEAADAAAKEQKADYAWLYYIEIADILGHEGKFEEAVKYVDALVERDRTNYRSASLKMRLAFAMGDNEKATQVLADFKANNEGYDSVYALEAAYLRITGDLEKSKLMCEEGIVDNDASPELHRQLALVYLCEGDYAKAFDEAFTADNNAAYIANYYMDSSNYTPQHDSTLYLCTMLCKNNNIETDNTVYVDQIIEYYGQYTPTNQVAAVLNGEKTAVQVLTEGVCDLA